MTATEQKIRHAHTQYLQEIGPFTAEPGWGRNIKNVMISIVPEIATMMFPPDRYADERPESSPEDCPATVEAFLVRFNEHAKPDADMLRDILAAKGRRFATAWEVEALIKKNPEFMQACEGQIATSLDTWAWTDCEVDVRVEVIYINNGKREMSEWTPLCNNFWYIVVEN